MTQRAANIRKLRGFHLFRLQWESYDSEKPEKSKFLPTSIFKLIDTEENR